MYHKTLGIACLNISCGTYETGWSIIEPYAFAEGWKKHLAQNIKATVHIPVIAVNTATFIGYKIAGVKGCLAATAGVVLPSFVIIYAISFILRQFENFAGVRYAFFGIRAAVLALILQALLSMYHACPKGKMEYILMAAAFAAVAIFDCSVLIVIVAAAVVGLACNHLINKETKEAGK